MTTLNRTAFVNERIQEEALTGHLRPSLDHHFAIPSVLVCIKG